VLPFLDSVEVLGSIVGSVLLHMNWLQHFVNVMVLFKSLDPLAIEFLGRAER
jgi:hypothetical protein